MQNKKNIIKKPFILTIFGASGDLAYLKLFPSIYELYRQNKLPKDFTIIGFARSDFDTTSFRKHFEKSIKSNQNIKQDTKKLSELLNHIHYFKGDYNDTMSFSKYFSVICKNNHKNCLVNQIVYLSTPPETFDNIISNIGKTYINKKHIKIVIEKPFGSDTSSATKLFKKLDKIFTANNIYLLDHYLGKSAVQSIFNLRNNNRIIAKLLTPTEISNIQINILENEDVKERVHYYDKNGAIKDIIQSHILQVLTLITTKLPENKDIKIFQKHKKNIIDNLIISTYGKNVSIGQYDKYRTISSATKKSNTETFVAIRTKINNQEFKDIPIYLRTGKYLKRNHTYITIDFKKTKSQNKNEPSNKIIIEFSPNPHLEIELINLQESLTQFENINISDSIACNIEGCLPDHAFLLNEIIQGKKLHFPCIDEIVSSWRFIDKVFGYIKKKKVKLEKYKKGSSGPKSQDIITKQDGFTWY